MPASLARTLPPAGNAMLARHVSGTLLRDEQVDDVDAEPPDPIRLDHVNATPATVAAAAPAGGRPSPQTLSKSCADCNAAVGILNSGAYVGEPNVQVAPSAGEPRVTKRGGTYTAAVDVSWAIDVTTSTMEVTDFAWPNMTAADHAAVDAYKAALLAHEKGHFTAVEAVLAKLPKTITATAGSGKAAMAALQAKVDAHIAGSQAAVDKATADYDAKTTHGATQSAVGGVDVHLQCPVAAP